jgi:hypothetical protein
MKIRKRRKKALLALNKSKLLLSGKTLTALTFLVLVGLRKNRCLITPKWS